MKEREKLLPPEEPNWIEIDLAIARYTNGSIVHTLESSREILRTLWDAGSQKGWGENLLSYFVSIKERLDREILELKRARNNEEAVQILFRD